MKLADLARLESGYQFPGKVGPDSERDAGGNPEDGLQRLDQNGLIKYLGGTGQSASFSGMQLAKAHWTENVVEDEELQFLLLHWRGWNGIELYSEYIPRILWQRHAASALFLRRISKSCAKLRGLPACGQVLSQRAGAELLPTKPTPAQDERPASGSPGDAAMGCLDPFI
jgi:hypothetical protein